MNKPFYTMSKLSIEEQANAYSCILACATQMYLSGDGDKATLEKLFPDLKQSKDEKIKQELLSQFKQYKSAGIVQYTDDLTINDVIAWIEKQKNGVNDRSAETASTRNIQPEDKPSFKVNDWVIMTKDASRKIMQIKTIEDDYYDTADQKGRIIRYSLRQSADWKLWTIEDAEPGDILASNDNIVMFKSIDEVKGENMQNYCTYYCDGTNEFHTNTFALLLCKSAYLPATAEQCKMLDEQLVGLGYVWDEKYKKLNKIDLRDVQNTVDGSIDALGYALDIIGKTYGDLPGYQYGNIKSCDAALNAITALNQNRNEFSWFKKTYYDNDLRLRRMLKDDIDNLCQKTGIDIDGIYHALKMLEISLGTVDGYQSEDGIFKHKCAINKVMLIYRYLK